jgi:hypothetical protein
VVERGYADGVAEGERKALRRWTGRDAGGECAECGALAGEEHREVCTYAVEPAWVAREYRERCAQIAMLHGVSTVSDGRVMCAECGQVAPCRSERAARGELEEVVV